MEFHIGITNLIYNLCRFLGKEREDGEILFLGRRDFQIKHMGYRIELGEIDAAALREPAIRNACVLYRTQEKKIVLIYESAQDLPARVLRADLAKVLPKYMLPTEFQQVLAMPRNPNGKIDRHQLAERFGSASM